MGAVFLYSLYFRTVPKRKPVCKGFLRLFRPDGRSGEIMQQDRQGVRHRLVTHRLAIAREVANL